MNRDCKATLHGLILEFAQVLWSPFEVVTKVGFLEKSRVVTMMEIKCKPCPESGMRIL